MLGRGHVRTTTPTLMERGRKHQGVYRPIVERASLLRCRKAGPARPKGSAAVVQCRKRIIDISGT
jgi:hypothetical protein